MPLDSLIDLGHYELFILHCIEEECKLLMSAKPRENLPSPLNERCSDCESENKTLPIHPVANSIAYPEILQVKNKH
jgi:hypothetical protein